MNKSNIFFLGCGKMGKIIVNNLIENNIYSRNEFLILKPSNTNRIHDITYIDSFNKIPKNYIADIIFICIKPQNSQKILENLSQSKIFNENTIFISILAGKDINYFANFFGDSGKIVRTMPNIAIEVKKGIIPLFFKNFLPHEKKIIYNIFSNFGYVFEVEKQDSFHALTALYGSGPAYIFLMQEIFKKISIEQKISPEISHKLVQELFLGSSLMSYQDNQDFQNLRLMVTSKKGITEASLKNLIKNNKLKNLIKKSVDFGIKKSQRLTKK
jgi:pyrroline-5-carboxylate reductase